MLATNSSARPVRVETGGASRRRSQPERRAIAEARLIEAATDLIAERGFAALVLADVGERAGYSRGLPAHYFGTKNALVSEVVRQIITQFGQRVDEQLGGITGLSVLLRFVENYLSNAAEDPSRWRALYAVFAEAQINPTLQGPIAEMNRASVQRLADAIRDGQTRGEIGPTIPAEPRAISILGTVRGVVAQWLVDPSAVDLAAASADLARAVEEGLRP